MTALLYAGIGSRETPAPVLDYMRRAAQRLAARGYTIRSRGRRRCRYRL